MPRHQYSGEQLRLRNEAEAERDRSVKQGGKQMDDKVDYYVNAELSAILDAINALHEQGKISIQARDMIEGFTKSDHWRKTRGAIEPMEGQAEEPAKEMGAPRESMGSQIRKMRPKHDYEESEE